MIHLKDRKTRYITALVIGIIVLIGFVLFAYQMNQPAKQMSEETFIELATQMDEMQTYMTIEGNTKVVFNKDAARKDGYAEDLIELTEEMVLFQNQMLQSTPSARIDQDMKQYPLLQEYWDAATRYNEKKK